MFEVMPDANWRLHVSESGPVSQYSVSVRGPYKGDVSGMDNVNLERKYMRERGDYWTVRLFSRC